VTVWVDDGLVAAADARVSVFDHGLTVGDGVFETAKVIDGVPFALTRHLRRLERSAAGLGLAPPAGERVRDAVRAVIDANPDVVAAPARLRVTVTGGPAPLGSDRGDARPTLLVALAPMRRWDPTAKVVVAPWVRNERSATAGLKTTSYAENVLALAYARGRGAAEALLANSVGELCEGTGSNVFLVRDGRVVTPSLRSGCLAGVTRQLLLEWAPEIVETDLPMRDLDAADEVFLTSSTRDVQPVHAVDDRPLEPGPVTARLAELFVTRAGADLDP
jgi:branched-chain amino acid aminotransferase